MTRRKKKQTFASGTDAEAQRQDQVEQHGLGPFRRREDETSAARLFQRVRLLVARVPKIRDADTHTHTTV